MPPYGYETNPRVTVSTPATALYVTDPQILQFSGQVQLYVNLLQAELKKGKEEIQRLKAALLDQEGAVLQRERQLADLKRQLKEEQRQGEAPLQMDQAIQADPVQCADLQVQVWDAALTALSWPIVHIVSSDNCMTTASFMHHLLRCLIPLPLPAMSQHD